MCFREINLTAVCKMDWMWTEVEKKQLNAKIQTIAVFLIFIILFIGGNKSLLLPVDFL